MWETIPQDVEYSACIYFERNRSFPMQKLNPAYVDVFSDYVNSCPYFKLLSLHLDGMRYGKSYLDLEINPKHMQPFGIIHGGVCASLVDAAVFWAVHSQIPDDVSLTTVELKLNYLAAVSTGSLRAYGECIKVGKTLCLGSAHITDAKGRDVAHGTATMMLLQNKPLILPDLPQKFID